MKTGLYIPLIYEFADPALVVEIARVAETAGWDGLFVSDNVYPGEGVPVCDAFVALAGVAAVTTTMSLGPLVTPIARRRPWVVARQATSLDHLSSGRLIFGTGFGEDEWLQEMTAFAERAQREDERQSLVDESLAVLFALWSGSPVRHDGTWLHVDSAAFLPTPVQRPRIPVWVSARWPRRNPLRRAALVEGIYPVFMEPERRSHPEPTDVRDIHDEVVRLGAPAGHDLVLRGSVGHDPGPAGKTYLEDLTAVGMTWWLEDLNPRQSPLSLLEKVKAGPPQA